MRPRRPHRLVRWLYIALVVTAAWLALVVSGLKLIDAHPQGFTWLVATMDLLSGRMPRFEPTTCPPRAMTVRTEDGRQGSLVLEPDDPWRGDPDAEVWVVVFGDFACDQCRDLSAWMDRLYAMYGSQVLFVFKSYPMDTACNPGLRSATSPRACQAQRAGVCAHDQGAFWEYARQAYRNQHTLGDEDLRGLAEVVGLDLDRFDACMEDPASLQAVLSDAGAGASLDIHGVPRVFLGGRVYLPGYTLTDLVEAIERARGTPPMEAEDVARERVERPLRDPEDPARAPAAREVSLGGPVYWMDTFEASLDDQGRALSQPDRDPATRMSWYRAREACDAAGRRLCTEREWIGACQGARAVDDDGDGSFADDFVEGTVFPYGDAYQPDACWVQDPRGTPVRTGSLPACRSEQGLYDLVGNQEEWVGATEETAMLMGGSYETPADRARCNRRSERFGPGFSAPRTGFRCCSDWGP